MTQPPVQPPPSWIDGFVAKATGAVGGPWGRHAVYSGWWTPLRVLMVMLSLTLTFAFMEKSPCASGEWNSNLQYTHVCYSDIIPLWSGEGFDRNAVPYRDHANEYPVLTGGFMWVAARITYGMEGLFTSAPDSAIFSVVNAAMLAACAFVVLIATARAAGARPWDAAIFACSPLLIFQAFTNWDLFAMALAAGALWAWSSRRIGLAGALIGLGTAAKLYPALFLLPIWVLALRTRQLRAAWVATAWAAGSWLAVNLPVAIAWNAGWRQFFTFNFSRSTEGDTLWYIVHYVTSGQLQSDTYADYKPPGFAVGLAVVAALGLVALLGVLAPRKPRLAQLAFLAVLVFLLASKIWSRQYSLWLLPLLALARPRWRSALLWQCSEIALWITFLLWLMGSANKGVDYGVLLTVTLIRDVTVVCVGLLVVRDVLWPSEDVARQHGLDDPGGGVFDGADDHWDGAENPLLKPWRSWRAQRRHEKELAEAIIAQLPD